MRTVKYKIASLLTLAACGHSRPPSSPVETMVISASAVECPNGGSILVEYRDTANTGAFVAGDPVISAQAVCDGQAGAAGPQGSPGPQGVAGQSGTNGSSIVITTLSASAAQCAAGGTIILMAQDAESTGIYSASDPDQTSVIVCDGASPSPISPITPIEACGAASSPWKEVLLCLDNGQVLADFSDSASGLNTRLSFISPGTYGDTDDSGCNFSVTEDATGDTTVSWGAGQNQYSTWAANQVTCTNQAK